MSVHFTVESFTSFDGTVMRYAHMKSGESENHQSPIVYVPGLGGTVKLAIAFLERLVPHHGPVYSLDARGFGLNEDMPPQPNPADYLKDLQPFIKYLQESNHIRPETSPLMIGLSLGGVYATLYATRVAHPFKAIILMAPAFSAHPTLFNWRFRLKNYAGILTCGIRAMTTLPYTIRELTRNPQLYEDPLFTEPLVMPTFYLFLVDLLCKKGFAATRRLNLPTAVVIPDKDVICNPATMRLAYERIPYPNKAIFNYPELFHDVVQEPEMDISLVCEDLTRWIMALDHSGQSQEPSPHHATR